MNKFNESTPNLNSQFAYKNLKDSLPYIRPGLLLTIFLVMFFYPIDPLMLNEEGASFLQNARVSLVPFLVALIVLTYMKVRPTLFNLSAGAIYTTGGLCFVYANHLSPNTTIVYTLVALVQAYLLLVIALRVPWRISTPCLVIQYLAALWVIGTKTNNDMGSLIAFFTGLAASGVIISVDSFIRDQNARRLFKAEAQFKKSQDDQVRWSALVTRVLKHELSNQITAVTTSVNMIKRNKQVLEEQKVYIDRAEKAIKQLRDTLNRTTNATTIQEALNTDNLELINVQELISDLLFQYEHNYPLVDFVTRINSDLFIKGNSALLSRAITNVIENAIRHHKAGTSIEITTPHKGKIVVENEGDPLPEDKQEIFEIGHAEKSSKTGLYGLGLFIVNKIAESHNGKAYAEDSPKYVGARFVLEFPPVRPAHTVTHTPSDTPFLSPS